MALHEFGRPPFKAQRIWTCTSLIDLGVWIRGTQETIEGQENIQRQETSERQGIREGQGIGEGRGLGEWRGLGEGQGIGESPAMHSYWGEALLVSYQAVNTGA